MLKQPVTKRRLITAVLLVVLGVALWVTSRQDSPSSDYTVSTLVDASGEPIVFDRPQGLAFDANDNLYVVELFSGKVWQVSPAGVVSLVVAEGTLSLPDRLAVDNTGNIYVTESADNQITRIDSDGTASVMAGTGEAGSADGNATQAEFSLPLGIVVDDRGTIYVADSGNARIREISPDGQVSTLAGNERGFADGQGETAGFKGISGLALDAAGNLYVADAGAARVRVITPDGLVTTLAGNGEKDFVDGPALEARFGGPIDVALDQAGNVYVADLDNHSLRLITPDGLVITIAGNGDSGYSDGPGSKARFNFPEAVAVDSAGVVYVADAGNGYVRLIKRATLP